MDTSEELKQKHGEKYDPVASIIPAFREIKGGAGSRRFCQIFSLLRADR
jgi:hypothetical protein